MLPSQETCLKLKLGLTFLSPLSLQAPRAGGVGAEEQEAQGETAPVFVPGPDVLGEPGRATGHRQADRCDREAGEGPPHLHQRTWDQSRYNERVMSFTPVQSQITETHTTNDLRHWSFLHFLFWIITSATVVTKKTQQFKLCKLFNIVMYQMSVTQMN